MRVESLVEFLDAAANTRYVNDAFKERGGIMIVGPPGTFKTTAIETAMDSHSDAIICSDLNVHQWTKMKDDFACGRYTTLAFPEFEKIYQRHPGTAANLEGIVKGLVGEGFSMGPGGDPRMPRVKSRALVVGGITTDCFERHYEAWNKNGFLRRFLWLVVAVENPEEIIKAIRRNKLIDFGKVSIRPTNRQIDVELPNQQLLQLERMMKEQPGLFGTGYVLIKKITKFLYWKYSNGDMHKVHEILNDIRSSLSKDGDRIILPVVNDE